MLGRVKRWVLAMLADAARGSVPGCAAFDPPCAWRSTKPVGTKDVPEIFATPYGVSNKGH